MFEKTAKRVSKFIFLAKYKQNDQVKKDKIVSVYSMHDKEEECMQDFGKPEGRRPLGRLIHRWEHNIKMDLREMAWWVVDWNHLAQVRDQ